METEKTRKFNGLLTIEEIREAFGSEGYTLLTDRYKNAFGYLDYVCSVGHKHRLKWNSWSNGFRCPYCANNAKPSINEIERSFSAEGYTLLSDEYVNSQTKLKYMCPEGHVHAMSYNSFAKGRRCGKCFGKIKHTHKYVKSYFYKFGYILLL